VNAHTDILAAPPAVYAKIAAVQADLAKEGIGKDRKNEQQKYNFRGIDDLYNAIAPILARHQLCILPRILSRSREERTTIKEWQGQRKESVLFYVTVEAEFDFIAAEDGSKHTIRTYGEAMDSADKATNKAMSAAYKYAAFMAFAIPTEGDNDADAVTHEVASRGNDQRGGEPEGMPDHAWAKLSGLLTATNTAPGVLTEHYRVQNLRLLSERQYGEAVERLEKRLADMAKEQSNRAGQADRSTGEFGDIHPDDVPF
jgi:hypothetical protein